MGFSKTETLEAVAKIWDLASEGKSNVVIADEMGLDLEIVTALRTQMLEVKTEELNERPVEHTYVEYMLNQLRNIHDLTSVIEKLRETKQYNQAMIGAIRTRAEIWDKLMVKGQECAVIKKAPEQKNIGVNVLVAELSNSELRTEIATSMSKLSEMVARHGETDFVRLPVPTELHHGPAVDSESSKKKKKKKKKKKMGKVRAKTARVSKGRVKERKPNPLKKGKSDDKDS